MKILLSCSIAGLALLADGVYAGGLEGYGAPSTVSVYGGVSAGMSSHDGACATGTTDCEDGDTGRKAFVGLRAEPNRNPKELWATPAGVMPASSLPSMGVELGYMELGENTAKGTAGRAGIYESALQSELTASYVAGVGYVPVAPRTELLGKVGAAFWKQNGSKTVAEDSELDTTSTNSGVSMLVGAGAQVKLNPNLSLRGEYERVLGTAADTDYEADASLLSVGAVFSTF